MNCARYLNRDEEDDLALWRMLGSRVHEQFIETYSRVMRRHAATDTRWKND